jgi:hypothetical protein
LKKRLWDRRRRLWKKSAKRKKTSEDRKKQVKSLIVVRLMKMKVKMRIK